jgi:hypothetical protein
MDERYLMHRLKSTSLAGIVGALVLGGWYFYDWLANDLVRRDILAVLMVMAVVKGGAMIYYRKSN